MNKLQKLYSLEAPTAPLPAAQAFLRHARFRLREDYLVKLKLALATLNDEQIWWRPNEVSNSIGNLLLHLGGNVRQWIVAGAGGARDTRARADEFTAQGTAGRQQLLDSLEDTLLEVDQVLAEVEKEVVATNSDAALQRIIAPQGFPQTVFDAIFHVVEHFSYHTGQIVYLAKQASGNPTQFYDEEALNQN